MEVTRCASALAACIQFSQQFGHAHCAKPSGSLMQLACRMQPVVPQIAHMHEHRLQHLLSHLSLNWHVMSQLSHNRSWQWSQSLSPTQRM